MWFFLNENTIVTVEIPPAGVHPSVLDAMKQEKWYLRAPKFNMSPTQQESDN